jgi:hypothetical protein
MFMANEKAKGKEHELKFSETIVSGIIVNITIAIHLRILVIGFYGC